MQQLFRLLIFLMQPYMFRATNSPILRSILTLYTVFGKMHRHCCRPVAPVGSSVGALYQKLYTGCNRRNGPDFGRVFLRSNYTDITQNTYIKS